MKVGRLLLCMLLSVAMVVTFIPVFSFAAEGAPYQFYINGSGEVTADGGDWYQVELENGKVYTENYDSDEGGFFANAGEEVYLKVVPDSDYSVNGAYYEVYDADGVFSYDNDLIWSESEGYYYFTMPDCEEGEEVTVHINFDYDGSGYDFDEDATAELELAGDREFVFDYDEGNVGFQEGDIITITYSDGTEMTFEYIEDEDNDQYGFYNGDIRVWTDYTPPVVGETSLRLNVFYDGEKITNFDIYFSVPVKVKSSVKSISFSPKTVTVYSEKIKEVDGDQVYYNLWNRHKFNYKGEEYSSLFDEGDSITVNYQNGTSKVYKYKTVFTYTDEQGGILEDYDLFVYGDDSLWPDDYIGVYDLVPGKNNTVTIYYGGATTTFNVFVETPAQRAEAARQGTLDASMPAVKAKKPKAAKKAITVKWKKLKKKQLKKVAKIEVWVSTNTAFAKGATIEKTVSKKKASVKIKGLKKGTTYFAKVRAIKYVNGKKVVGKWSTIKKVKVKK